MPEDKGIELVPGMPRPVESAPKIENIPAPEEVKETLIESIPEVAKEAPQATIEKMVETPKATAEKKVEGGLAAQSSVASIQKRREEAIDKILSEGLNEIFLSMSPAKQKEFQKKGEETTKKINELLGEAKVKVNKIIDLIKRWLKLIPGVNKFFLEQETKLKVDKIMNIKDNI